MRSMQHITHPARGKGSSRQASKQAGKRPHPSGVEVEGLAALVGVQDFVKVAAFT